MFNPRQMKFSLLSTSLLITAALPLGAWSQVTRVEIDWQVTVAEPDAEAMAPQISIILANETTDGDFAEFKLNPEGEGTQGGILMKTWRGQQELGASSHLDQPPLSTENDRIRFTTSVEVNGGTSTYALTDVSSTQWGNLPDSASATCEIASVSPLQFSINETLYESEVEFGHNRVTHVIAREIRFYIGDNLAKRDRTGYYLFRDGGSHIGPVSAEEIIETYIAY